MILSIIEPKVALADPVSQGSKTWQAFADVRLLGVNGERSWSDGGFGKLRSGGEGEWRVQPELGNISLAWHPEFSWALSATVVGRMQGGDRTEAGLSEAFIAYRPMRSERLSLSARAGLMWPPVSVEHEGIDWHVRDSVTPSAINSWIGEEVKVVGMEGNASVRFGEHRVRATAALFAANDTAGTLLTFRGWALHDRVALAFRRMPLPPLENETLEIQAPFTHPLLDVEPHFARRPGYYAKVAWQPPLPLAIEVFHYDNRADPEAVNDDLEWGWRTRFTNLSATGKIGSLILRGQALSGTTLMGFAETGRRWVDESFRSAFVLATLPLGSITAAARAERFMTHNRGSLFNDEYDDRGWSAMASLRRDWLHFTGVIELLHVSSDREDRAAAGIPARQRQTQLQLQLRTSL